MTEHWRKLKTVLNIYKVKELKKIIPPNIIIIYTRLEVLIDLKISGHSDTLAEAIRLFDELYKRGEIQNEQQYRNALNNFQY